MAPLVSEKKSKAQGAVACRVRGSVLRVAGQTFSANVKVQLVAQARRWGKNGFKYRKPLQKDADYVIKCVEYATFSGIEIYFLAFSGRFALKVWVIFCRSDHLDWKILGRNGECNVH
jgi:hypothetical protein